MLEILALIGAIALLVAVLHLRQALAMVFPRYQARVIPALVPPPAIADLVQEADAALRAIGFDEPLWLLVSGHPASAAPPRPRVVYRNRMNRALCWLLPPASLTQPNRLNVLYSTLLEDGRLLTSQAYDPYFAATATPEFPGLMLAESSYERQWQAHQAWRATFPFDAASHALDEARIVDEAGEAMNRRRDALVRERRLRLDADGIARPRLRYAYQILRQSWRRPRAPTDARPVPAARLALLAETLERIRAQVPSTGVQWSLFGISVALFVLLGAMLWDLRLAVLLAFAIALHEGGHYLAMRAFGYRNVHMLALPLVGGVTLGTETDPSAAKRAWMSLAGPLPGIVLGWLLLALAWSGQASPDAQAWLMPGALVLLGLNYLNVLPIPPLDGGEVVRALLPPRWLWLHAVFLLLACGIGLVAAISAGWIALSVIIALQFGGVHLQWLIGRALRGLGPDTVPPAGRPRPLRLTRVFEALETSAGPAVHAQVRIGQAEAMLRVLDVRPMGWTNRIVIGTLMLVLLAVPVAAGVAWYGQGSTDWIRGGVGSTLASIDSTDPLDDPDERARRARVATLPLATLMSELESANAPATGDAASADDGSPDATAPADAGAIGEAERRLSIAVTDDVRAVYALRNGAPALMLAPIGEWRRGPLPRDLLAEGDETGVQRVVLDRNDPGAASVDIPRATLDAMVAISPEAFAFDTVLLYDGAAEAAVTGHRVLEIEQGLVIAHRDLRAWVEARWLDEVRAQAQVEHLERRRSEAARALAGVPIGDLLDDFPEPDLLTRLLSPTSAWPGEVAATDLAATEARLGIALADDHRQLLRKHDGFPPLGLLPARDLQPAGPGLAGIDARIRESWLERRFSAVAADGTHAASAPLPREELDACIAIAGLANPEGGAGGANPPTLAMVTAVWCPKAAPGRRVVDLMAAQTYDKLEDWVRLRAANIRAFPHPG